MIRNYFKIAWRTIVRNKSYSAINIAGLTVGIAACLLIFVVVQYELSFDTYQPGYKNIYRIVSKTDREGVITYNDGIAAPAARAFRLYFPQAIVAGIDATYGSQITAPAASGSPADDKKFIENTGIMFADPQLFNVLSVNWLSGSASALKDPNMVVIDKSSAEKYFGDWHTAMGKTLKMDNLITLKVAGVIQDVPVNTNLPLKVLISYITWKQNAKNYSYQDNWNATSSNCQVYIKFPPNVMASTIDQQLRSFSEKQFDNKKHVYKKYEAAQPLADIHFNTSFGDTLGDHVTSMATLRTLSFIAALIIIMASINFINLSTAQSVGRSKEVGIRKVLGSTRKQLIGQAMGETTLIVLLSSGLALGVAELALPFLKNIASVPANTGLFNTGTMLCLAMVIIAVVILSGIYPALIVSGFKPILALKNKINAAAVGGISLRRVLVVTQFAISQLLIIGTVIAIKQMNFVNNADLGFNKDAVLIIPCSTDSIGLSRINSFKQQVLALPGVKAASFTSDVPSSDNNSATSFTFNHSGKDPGFDVFMKVADADYFKTFGLRFLAGQGYDQSDTSREVVINETLMRKLGIKRAEDAIGKTISFGNNKWLPIVGVVADFKTNSMREEVKPLAIYSQKQLEQEIAVKIQGKKLAQTTAALQNLWENRYPEYAYTGFFVDESIAKFYKQENQLELIYKIFALIAIFISCLGLYGLVSFMAVQRTREVGIRKVLGASIGSIVYLFSKEFIALIVIAFALGAPAAWFLMKGWLQTFAYRISPGVWVFMAAIATSLLIGWLTVGYKAVRAALVNPVKSLRSE
jgi:putative ABC transport system permease protein